VNTEKKMKKTLRYYQGARCSTRYQSTHTQKKMRTTTTFTKSEWESMETVSEATKANGKIKSRNGSKYEWTAGGKRVTAKKI
jgi:hypothetical protein